MQQVRLSPAAASAIDPRRLPVALRRGGRNRFLIALHHKWVLHRQLIIRITAGLACAVVLSLGFQARGGIMQTTRAVADLMSGKFAAAGFGVSAIEISGQSITSEKMVVEALGLTDTTSTLSLDAEAARERLIALPAIESASVRKIYPGQLIVDVSEKEPVARWTVDGTTYLVDRSGDKLGAALPADEHLPLVIGSGAADDALVMVRALERFPMLNEGLLALSRIADRRWDLIYQTGLRVKLPEMGVAQALNDLKSYQTEHRLMDRDVSVIDLRVPSTVAVQLVVREQADEES